MQLILGHDLSPPCVDLSIFRQIYHSPMYAQLIEEEIISHNQVYEKSPSDAIIYCQTSLQIQLILILPLQT